MKAGKNDSSGANDPNLKGVKGNPIIFARRETVHIPAKLASLPPEVINTIYSVDNSGKLKPVPTPRDYPEKEESDDETGVGMIEPARAPFWKRMFCCCMGSPDRKKALERHSRDRLSMDAGGSGTLGNAASNNLSKYQTPRISLSPSSSRPGIGSHSMDASGTSSSPRVLRTNSSNVGRSTDERRTTQLRRTGSSTQSSSTHTTSTPTSPSTTTQGGANSQTSQPLRGAARSTSSSSLAPTRLIGRQRACDMGKKTLVLDLDETLVHSSFQPVQDYHYLIPVEIDGTVYNVYVYRRPHAVEFIKHLSKMYEIVVYTASLRKYADPLLDQMDTDHIIAYRLFREHCVMTSGVFVKNLDSLGRDLARTIIIDNASASFMLNPKNGIECLTFLNDFTDHELSDLIPFLEFLHKKDDVREYANQWVTNKSQFV